MSPTIDEQIEGLKRAIAEMETQRESLSDEVVEAGLVPFQRKLDELIAMPQVREARPHKVAVQQRELRAESAEASKEARMLKTVARIAPQFDLG